jgi:lipopolysaccharide transport protein LptA
MIESLEELEKEETSDKTDAASTSGKDKDTKDREKPAKTSPTQADDKPPAAAEGAADQDEARPDESPGQPAPTGKASSPVADGPTRKERSKAPIKLKSDGRSTYSRDGGLVHLRKNVVITQEDLRLQADEAKVFVREAAEDEERIDKVEFTGSVKFTKFDQRPSEQVSAHGNRAIFYNERQEVILIGNARIWKGNQLIRGKRVIYDVATGMIEVDQAVGVVQPDEAQE